MVAVICSVEGCETPRRGLKDLCRKHSVRLQRHGDVHVDLRSQLRAVPFVASSITVLETPCHVWMGSTNRGYGQRTIGGKRWLLHRWVWTQAHGEIPPGILILHRCDNPPCYRLDHLFAGSHTDNARDKYAKGRQNHSNAARGEAHPRAKLTAAQIPAIRMRLANGESAPAIARDYPVQRRTIQDIRTGKTWAAVA